LVCVLPAQKVSIRFAAFGVISTLISFLFSTQTYNLLSGTFFDITIKEEYSNRMGIPTAKLYLYDELPFGLLGHSIFI
jgi:hypothetical protein